MENIIAFTGLPASLKYHLSGFWSRIIDDEHWLIYAADAA
jgi:Txe/YoeB family toxin of Txe-Axe toxin-antitoxin module